MEMTASTFNTLKLTPKEFNTLSEFIQVNYGIKMPPVKRTMLQSRLQKRLRELNMSNFTEYMEYVFSHDGQQNELFHMIDVVSTNKTDFFREATHFDFLTNNILKNYVGKHINIWSAGCSSGEEPYTIAMVMQEFISRFPGTSFAINATDISTRMLKKGVEAIYTEEKVAPIPLDLKRKYLLRSKDRTSKQVRIIPDLRRKVSFSRLNFMDNTYHVAGGQDIVFCRNVLIYFDQETQEKVINKICTKIKPGGILFLGHSESITRLNVPLTQIKPTVFIKNTH